MSLVEPSGGGGNLPAGGGGGGGGTNMSVHWGDDLCYTFTVNLDGSYTAPTGIFDTLVANGSPTITSYDLTTKNQVKYHFTNPNGTGWYVATISDLNGN